MFQNEKFYKHSTDSVAGLLTGVYILTAPDIQVWFNTGKNISDFSNNLLIYIC